MSGSAIPQLLFSLAWLIPLVSVSVIAIVVALTGVLATLTTLVAERRREMAIRSAIGASPTRLVRAIVGQG